MNSEMRRVKSEVLRKGLLLLLSCFILHPSAFPQQPQAPAGTPLYSANAKYVNGMAPGYWPTAGNGLTLSLSAGTSYCGNPPAPVSYPGGSLALTASATNYIYLDPANNCSPSASASAFAGGRIPIATVVTGTSSITSIADARTWFQSQPCVTGATGSVSCSSLGTNQNISLTPSGNGASVITNLVDNGGQVFNVKSYGAKGDGATNDSPAFQSAYIAAVAAGGGVVYVPPSNSCYLLSTAINMTEDNHVVKLVGTRGFSPTGVGSSGAICANTGGVLFDLTNSSHKTLENLDVTAQSGVTTPSLIGILLARNASNASGQNDYVIDCRFAMPLHSSGTTYSFGAYLYGSEITFMTRDIFVADYPLVVTATNDFSVTSPFDTLGTGVQSEAGDQFKDMELQTAGLGNAVYFSGTWDMVLTGHSWNFNTVVPYPSSLQQYALALKSSNFSTYIKWRQEGFPGFVSVQYSLENSQIKGTDAPFADASSSSHVHAIEFTDAAANILHDSFAILDEYPFTTTNYYYDSSESTFTGVAILDDVDFYCGTETNCVNIPVGLYGTGYPMYWNNIRWSGGVNNEYPNVSIGGDSLTGTFSLPATSVPATSCSSLTGFTSLAATRAAQPVHFRLSPDFVNGLAIHMNGYAGTTTPEVCNPTSSAITPPATTIYWRLEQ